MWRNVERSWHMITNIVDQCSKVGKRKKRKPPWIDNRAHKAHKKVMTTRKGNHLIRIGKTIRRH